MTEITEKEKTMELSKSQAEAIIEAHDISTVMFINDEENELLKENNPELHGAYQALLDVAGLSAPKPVDG